LRKEAKSKSKQPARKQRARSKANKSNKSKSKSKSKGKGMRKSKGNGKAALETKDVYATPLLRNYATNKYTTTQLRYSATQLHRSGDTDTQIYYTATHIQQHSYIIHVHRVYIQLHIL
jgi:isoleucyl-tRNA synthetase